jgi:hypothetical protein
MGKNPPTSFMVRMAAVASLCTTSRSSTTRRGRATSPGAGSSSSLTTAWSGASLSS